MVTSRSFENYPFWMVLVVNIFSLSIYVLGAAIIYRLGLIWMILYLLFILFLEFRLVKDHCVDCYYYGKTCASGKGRLSRLLFRKGNVKRFCQKEMTFKDFIPDLLVSLVPVSIGIVLLILRFEFLLLLLILFLSILAFAGNAFMHTRIICNYCKQRLLGCPAQKMFDKDKPKSV